MNNQRHFVPLLRSLRLAAAVLFLGLAPLSLTMPIKATAEEPKTIAYRATASVG